MSKSGQSNYRGVDSQAKAAILLFLINFYEGDFDSLTLEDSNWEDFTLSFKSGKKIIAEAKAWDRPLKLNDVVNILQGIAPKSDQIKPGDEILIVCNSVDSSVMKSTEYLRYDLPISEIPGLKSYRKPEKLTDNIINLLKITKFYQLPKIAEQTEDDFLFNETVARLYRILPMWIPQHEIEMLMTHILKEKVYDKSERGDILTKVEFIQYLEEYKRTKIAESIVYDPERQKVKKQVEKIISAINSADDQYLLEAAGNLAALSAQPMQMYIALDSISNIKDLKLEYWDFIWKALVNRTYGFRVIGIFEDNIKDLENAKYVIRFLDSSITELLGLSMEGHTREHSLTLVSSALSLHEELYPEALSFIERYLEPRAKAYKKALTKRDLGYEKGNVGKVLTAIYNAANQKNDEEVKQKVIDLIAKYFNLSEDDGEYLTTTPAEVYGLVRQWLEEDFYGRFSKVVSLIVDDFNEGEFYKKGFNGWELIGGMESGWSNYFTLHDRGFIDHILTPAMNKEYAENPTEFWKFAVDNIFTLSINEVSANKPDFISRAAIDITVDEYFNGTNSDDAYRVLTKFLKMMKGIPDRGRLIFQLLRGRGDTATDKAWKLSEFYLSLAPNKLPPNTYLEDVILNLATKGNKRAIEHIDTWMKNPDYINEDNRFHFYADTVIEKLLNSKIKNVQLTGIRFLKNYLAAKGSWERGSATRTWDINPLLFKSLQIDREAVSSLILSLYFHSGDLTNNRQLVLTSLLSQPELKSSEDISFIYKEIVKPILFADLNGDITKIVEKFTERHARQNIINFAEKMMETGQLNEAMELVYIFLNDPDPSIENYSDDPEGTFNYHQKIKDGEDPIIISTVRGWIPFVLQKAIKVKGAYLMPEIIDITERLLKDENYYVRFQALILLSGLAQNRHTVLPPGMKKRFMTFKNAQRIEDMAFTFLENDENRKMKPLMERMFYCFNFMRDLDEVQAKRLISSAHQLEYGDEIDHLSSLYLFFAEFRKGSFKKVPSLGKRLSKKLSNFDDTYFKEVLKEEVLNGKKGTRRHLAWQFWQLVKKDADKDNYEDNFNISYKYLLLLAENYDHDAFEMLFHFIDDNLEKKPDEVLALWKIAAKSEKKYLIENEDDITYHHNYWDKLHTADILLFILNRQGVDEFLSSLEIMLSYPAKLQGIHNPQGLYDALKLIEDDRAKLLREKFEDNYPHVYAKEISSKNGNTN